jgi:hypothetical protein
VIAGHRQRCGVVRDNRESGVNPEQSCCRDDEVFQMRKQTNVRPQMVGWEGLENARLERELTGGYLSAVLE